MKSARRPCAPAFGRGKREISTVSPSQASPSSPGAIKMSSGRLPGCVFGAHKCGSGTLDGEDAAQAFQAGCRRPCPAAQVNDESLICQSAQCFKHRALGPPARPSLRMMSSRRRGAPGVSTARISPRRALSEKEESSCFFKGCSLCRQRRCAAAIRATTSPTMRRKVCRARLKLSRSGKRRSPLRHPEHKAGAVPALKA